MKRSKLDIARERYPKGVRFYSAYSKSINTSTGRVEEDAAGNIHDTASYFYYNGDWARLEGEGTVPLSRSVDELEVSIMTFKRPKRKLIICDQP